MIKIRNRNEQKQNVQYKLQEISINHSHREKKLKEAPEVAIAKAVRHLMLKDRPGER